MDSHPAQEGDKQFQNRCEGASEATNDGGVHKTSTSLEMLPYFSPFYARLNVKVLSAMDGT